MDSEIIYSRKSRIISVGNTSVAWSMGVSTEGLEDFGYGDVYITTIDGSIFILSGNVYSIRGAVMEYLYQELNAEVYSSNAYSVDRKTEGVNYVLQEQNLIVRYDMDICTTFKINLFLGRLK